MMYGLYDLLIINRLFVLYHVYLGCALGANAYWSTAVHVYTPLPFRPGRGFGDLFRTHFFVNAGNLSSVNLSKICRYVLLSLMRL